MKVRHNKRNRDRGVMRSFVKIQAENMRYIEALARQAQRIEELRVMTSHDPYRFQVHYV